LLVEVTKPVLRPIHQNNPGEPAPGWKVLALRDRSALLTTDYPVPHKPFQFK